MALGLAWVSASTYPALSARVPQLDSLITDTTRRTLVRWPITCAMRSVTCTPSSMLRFLKRLFPERIFRRKLEPEAERRLRLAQARAEESIVRTHVDNALMFVDTL